MTGVKERLALLHVAATHQTQLCLIDIVNDYDEMLSTIGRIEEHNAELLAEVMNYAYAPDQNFDGPEDFKSWVRNRARFLSEQYGAKKG